MLIVSIQFPYDFSAVYKIQDTTINFINQISYSSLSRTSLKVHRQRKKKTRNKQCFVYNQYFIVKSNSEKYFFFFRVCIYLNLKVCALRVWQFICFNWNNTFPLNTNCALFKHNRLLNLNIVNIGLFNYLKYIYSYLCILFSVA